ncbi:MAG: Ltp family lipoprotein [Chloroflexi bacterium]|nr:Ltp family lipoprotein [Chloroflexota bacterium]
MKFLKIAAAVIAVAASVTACAPDRAAPRNQGTAAPVPTEQAANPDPGLTNGQRNAIESAESYLAFSAFSESGLVDQLEFEGYSTADATFAVGSLDVDWNEQAAKSAAAYLEFSSFSLPGLIEQLEFEGFTAQQATYGANKAYNE